MVATPSLSDAHVHASTLSRELAARLKQTMLRLRMACETCSTGAFNYPNMLGEFGGEESIEMRLVGVRRGDMLKVTSMSGQLIASMPFKFFEQMPKLKRRIEDFSGIPVISQNLIQDGQVLADADIAQPKKDVTLVREHRALPADAVFIKGTFRQELPENYVIKLQLESDGNGQLFMAEDMSQEPPAKVTVKWIEDFACDPLRGKRTLREIKLLATLRHENLMKLYDLCPMPGIDFDNICMVLPHADVDLQRVIYSKMRLTPGHVQAFMCQIFRGLKYLHSVGVLHGDLKPENCLVNKDCRLKLASFGLARTDDDNLTFAKRTSCWYDSPETFLIESFDEASDLWAAGCVHGELLMREPVFPGKNLVDMLKLIIGALGFSSERDLAWVPDNKNSVFACIRSLNPDKVNSEPLMGKRLRSSNPDNTEANCALSSSCLEEQVRMKAPSASNACVSFLQGLLVFNPRHRITAAEALNHDYLEDLQVAEPENMEKIVPNRFSWEFENLEPTKQALQHRIYAECARLHPWVTKRDSKALRARGLLEE